MRDGRLQPIAFPCKHIRP